MSWLDKFPGVPRPLQEEIIEELESSWEDFDVFLVSAPTGIGKSFLAKTIMENNYCSSYLAPTNMLVNQFADSFPDTTVLHRMDTYWCSTWHQPCSATRAKYRGFCKKELECEGCEKLKHALINAKYKNGPIASNYHIFQYQKLDREVMIFDESHLLPGIIKSALAKTLWQHDIKYPDDAYSYEQLTSWIMGLEEKKRESKKIRELHTSLISRKPTHTVERTIKPFNGKGTKRGEPEDRSCLELLPVNINKPNTPQIFWGGKANKLVLLSATAGRKDIEELGLFRFSKRVKYIECGSPIDPTRRLVIFRPLTALNCGNIKEEAPALAQYIQKLSRNHCSEKGVIHVTYQLARLLKEYLSHDSRFLFHTPENKKDVFKTFIESREPKILMASGMYEGIDLPGDLGRWQVIAKIPWPSLGDAAVKYKADEDPEWYYWETLKTVIQACGRICRSEKDYGVTYIIDGSWEKLRDNSERLDLIPTWFKEALR